MASASSFDFGAIYDAAKAQYRRLQNTYYKESINAILSKVKLITNYK